MNELYINSTGTEEDTQSPPRPKRKKWPWITGGIALVVVGITLAVILRPGFLKPIDLGITATEADYQSALNKLGQTRSLDGSMPTYTGQHPVDIVLTSQELTALAQYGQPPNGGIGTDVQIKVGGRDGTQTGAVAISGTAQRDWLMNEFINGAYDTSEVSFVLGAVPRSLHFFLEASGSYQDAAAAATIQNANAHGFNVPEHLLRDPEAADIIALLLGAYIDTVMNATGSTLSLVEIVEDGVHIVGAIPDSIVWQ